MENTNEINRKIADNLIRFRKAAGYTQAELAEKINYSDKSVSKWESGNGIPDVYTLMQLAELYGVTLNDFVGDETDSKTEKVVTDEALKAKERKKINGLRLLIMLLSSGIVWLVATCFFVMMKIWLPGGEWKIGFVYAVMANAIVLIVFSGIWRYRWLNFISVSVLIWISIACLYITLCTVLVSQGKNTDGLKLLFAIGAPLQVLEILWVFFRSLFQKFYKETEKSRLKKTRKAEKKATKEVKKGAKKAMKKATKEAKTAAKIAAKYKKEVEKANK